MDKMEQFWKTIKQEMTVILSTAAEGRVTMRVISPVYYEGKILLFTHKDSKKYCQLQANRHCCVAAGGMFAETEADFCGSCMLLENQRLREVYCEKFPGAFDEGAEFGGRNAEFLLLQPTRLSGWDFEAGASATDIPTIPFEIVIGSEEK